MGLGKGNEVKILECLLGPDRTDTLRSSLGTWDTEWCRRVMLCMTGEP